MLTSRYDTFYISTLKIHDRKIKLSSALLTTIWTKMDDKCYFVHIFLLNTYLDVLSLPPFIYSIFHSLKMHLRNVKALAGVLYWNYCPEVALCLSASLTSLLSSSERRREWQWMCLRQRLAFKKTLNYDRRKRDQSTRRTRQTVDYDKI